MRIFKRIAALVLALIIGLSVSVSTMAITSDIQTSRPQAMTMREYKEKLWEEGFPVFTTEQFLKIYGVFSKAFNIITGRFLYADEHMNVTVDEFVTAACDHVYSNSGLDIVAILKNFPNINDFAELTVKTFEIDTAEFRDQMYDQRDAYWDEGDTFMSSVYFFLGAYFSVIEKCEVASEVTADDPNIYEVILILTYKDGGQETLRPGIFINTVTGECTNANGNNSGLVGTGFNFNIGEMMVYATISSWMRQFGFCMFYDIAANSAPLLWNYVTRRFKFEYQDLEWMIQIWKGNYLITNGGEVGVYNRNPEEKFGTFYNTATDDQLMEMSLQVYHGDELLVNQEPQMHWWVNGFHMGERRYIPDSLTMKFSILMPDEEMLNAFCEAIDNHYRKDVTYTVDGLTISVVW